MTQLKRTPLYDRHLALGAKLTPFAGFEMPVQYHGIMAEHEAVRTAAGLFDISHMGEFAVSGSGAESFLQSVAVNDVAALQVGQAQYSAICRPDGGLIDDLLIYRRENGYMLVVNAANIAGDFDWLTAHAGADVTLEDISDSTALIAVQGPHSRKILEAALGDQLAGLDFYHFSEGSAGGAPAIISRTGYTGDLGFEIYTSPAAAPLVWDDLLQAGAEFGLRPAGLGARDTLRLEMKYCLYGNDITIDTNPIEAGLGWITKLDKGPFIGSEAISADKAAGPDRRLVCLVLEERAVPRPGYPILAAGDPVGTVTSGTQSLTLKQGIALGYVARGFTKSGTELAVEIRGRRAAARVVKPPFVTGTSLMD